MLLRYKQIYQALDIAKEYIKDKKPDLIVLVDYIEFNLKVAKYARNLGIHVLFYIAPQVLAWREKRAKKFVQATNHLAVIFPFEEIYFKKYTNNVTYVGHPLSKVSGLTDSVKDYDQRNIDLGLFPGSRE